ncbi:MAG: hypothetical protein R3F34_17700 [Planctomycetota bacterium]
MKNLALVALALTSLVAGRALTQDSQDKACSGCCPVEAAKMQVKAAAEKAPSAEQIREAKEAELLAQWSRYAVAQDRLAMLDGEIVRLEGDLSRLSEQFQTKAVPAGAVKVMAPVRATAPVMPQCGASCAQDLRNEFDTNASCGSSCDGGAMQVKAAETVTPKCGSSCAQDLREKFATNATSGESCGSCDGAAMQVKAADEACDGGSCCGSSCDGAAKVQVKAADEGCCSEAAPAAMMVKAFDRRGRAIDACPHATAASISCCEIDSAIAAARSNVVRTEAAVKRAEVRVRGLKSEVAMAKLGYRFEPAAQQVKALAAPTGDCGGCQGSCDHGAVQVKKAEGECGGGGCCGGCEGEAAPMQVKKAEAECGGCCAGAKADS